MSCGAAAGVGQDKIGGLGADGEDHIASVITDLGIWVRGKVV
jgi:hypothetical protein